MSPHLSPSQVEMALNCLLAAYPPGGPVDYLRAVDPRQAGRWRKDPEGGAVFFPPRPLPPFGGYVTVSPQRVWDSHITMAEWNVPPQKKTFQRKRCMAVFWGPLFWRG